MSHDLEETTIYSKQDRDGNTIAVTSSHDAYHETWTRRVYCNKEQVYATESRADAIDYAEELILASHEKGEPNTLSPREYF